ncbi:von Willebrand factor A domain-containing protein 5A [Tritrichomonas musculus]|uniref:von Willebrand factor A domain-containing protein 5A n=1 Tax=Tritrichomonas musculus TaxID=1915356 RepID=A0ABR2H7F1_9EUKA
MVFGTCCILIDDHIKSMNTKSVKIEGVQRGLLVNFEVTQTFIHTEKEAKEVSYVFPNDLKICIYDTTFVVGDEIIKPKLQSKDEAKKTYDEAVDAGHTAVLGINIGYGMTQFKLGNVQPETECKVILKLAFTGHITKEKSFFVKFPIDVYTPSGSRGCLDINSSEFSFKLQSDPEKVTKVTSNVKNSKFDSNSKLFSIIDKIENDKNEKSIILTFETKEAFKSSCFISPTDSVNFDGCCISISPNLQESEDTNSEFVFVVDCSGSMGGNSIKKASECLEFFIKSLPEGSFFNVVCFGSRFEKLFDSSVSYNDQTLEKAVALATNLKANLGGTNIYSPLESIYSEKCEHGQRQIFIMTDGEVSDVEQVLDLISSHSNENRCFTIGIGRGCDAGLVEGIANASGGISDFVQEGDSISEKVIPQLQSSLHPSVTSLEIHIEGEENDSFEVSPYPLPPVNAKGSTVVFLRQKKRENAFEGGILITGNYGKESVEIPIEESQRLANVEEDKFGCSSGRNIGKAIVPLFAFSILQRLERKRNISDEEKARAIELSISSNVLCKYTGFVGMTEQQVVHQNYRACGGCCAAPMMMNCCCCRCAAPMAFSRPGHGSGRGSRHPPPKTHERIEKNSKCCAAHHLVNYEMEAGSCSTSNEVKYPTKYELISLTRYQKAGGFWDDLDAVKSITGISVEHIDVNLPDKDDERRCIATIVAIAAMRAYSPDEKNSWGMIEQKALAWLKKTLPNVNIEQAISQVQSKAK